MFCTPVVQSNTEVYLRADITNGCRPRNVYLTHARCVAALDAWLAVRLQRRWGFSGADGLRHPTGKTWINPPRAAKPPACSTGRVCAWTRKIVWCG